MAIKRHVITLPLNGAEWIELDTMAQRANITMPAYVRMCCGFEPWISRGREMAGRGRTSTFYPAKALDRVSITVAVTATELAGLEAGAAVAGISLPQFVRTRCGFQPRNAPMPGTEEREREEDDAWDRLVRLGIDPKPFFEE